MSDETSKCVSCDGTGIDKSRSCTDCEDDDMGDPPCGACGGCGFLPCPACTRPRGVLSVEEQLTNAETMRHILTVRALLMEAVRELTDRARKHDQSKLSAPEVDTFTKYTPLLKQLTYGSEEYAATLKAMGPALDNHYACNSHHPEHFADGIRGMDLFDLLEMMLDWKSATLRHADGDLSKSLKINTKRYQIPEPLLKVLENTVERVNRMAVEAHVAVSYPSHVE